MRRLLFVLLLLASSCGQNPKTIFRVGISVFPAYEFLHLSDDLNLLPRDEIKLVDYLDLGDSRRAFELHQISALLCTNAELEILARKGHDMTVAYVLDASIGADLVVAAPAIENVESLEGARVGVEHGAVSTLLLHHLIEHFQLDPDSIQLYHGNQNELIHAFDEGDVDAVVTYYPYSQELLEMDGAHTVYDTSHSPELILDLLVVDSEEMEEHGQQVDLLIRGLQEAIKYRSNEPAVADSLMANRERVTVDEFRSSLASIKLFTLEEQEAFFSEGALRQNMLDCSRLMQLEDAGQPLGRIQYRHPAKRVLE